MRNFFCALIALFFLVNLVGCNNRITATRIPVSVANSNNEPLWEMEWDVIYSKDDNVLIGIEVVLNNDYESEVETLTLRKFLNGRGQDCLIIESHEIGVNDESNYVKFDINTFEVRADEYLMSGILEYRDYYPEGEEVDLDGRRMDCDIMQVNELIPKSTLLTEYDNQKNPTMIIDKGEQKTYARIQYKEIADQYPKWSIEETEHVSHLMQETFVEFFYLHEHFCYSIL